jgi:hypothetical protein
MAVRASKESNNRRRQAFWHRMLVHSAISLGLLLLILGGGMWGYWYFEDMAWRDAFANSAMLLSGMGPLKTDLSEGGKVFAGVYALICGLVVIGITGLLLAPSIHHLMHKVHWEDRP